VDGALFGCARPDERVEWNVAAYRNMIGRHRRYDNLPTYIFQFGALQSEHRVGAANLKTCEPGGRGAAWTFHVLMGMKERVPNHRGVWQWGIFDKLSVGPEQLAWSQERERRLAAAGQVELLQSNGWVYAVLDRLQGGDALVADAPEAKDGTLLKALFVRKEDACYLVVSAFLLDRADNRRRAVSVTLPKSLGLSIRDAGALTETELTEDNCVHAAVKRDLAAAGLLKAEYADKPLLAQVRLLLDEGREREGRAKVVANADKYERIVRDSLTLKPFVGSVEDRGGDSVLSFTMAPNSVKALAIGRGRS